MAKVGFVSLRANYQENIFDLGIITIWPFSSQGEYGHIWEVQQLL